MEKVINGILYSSIDFAGSPTYFAVKSCFKNDAVVHIESEIDGCPIQIIDERAFFKNNVLEEIEIPDTVYRINIQAFWGCSLLKTVKVYKSNLEVKMSSISIGSEAFCNCRSLNSIETDKLIQLNGQMIFHNCFELENLNKDNVLVGSIYSMDFYNCIALNKLKVIGQRCRLWTDCFKATDNLETIIFDCRHVQAPKSVMRLLKKRKILCSSSCNLADLIYSGANVQFID